MDATSMHTVVKQSEVVPHLFLIQDYLFMEPDQYHLSDVLPVAGTMKIHQVDLIYMLFHYLRVLFLLHLLVLH